MFHDTGRNIPGYQGRIIGETKHSAQFIYKSTGQHTSTAMLWVVLLYMVVLMGEINKDHGLYGYKNYGIKSYR